MNTSLLDHGLYYGFCGVMCEPLGANTETRQFQPEPRQCAAPRQLERLQAARQVTHECGSWCSRRVGALR